MRNLFVAVLAVALISCSSSHAGLSVTVSVGTDIYDCDWDNVLILNDNLIGYWVVLDGVWILRCSNMQYNDEEWSFGAWWYDRGISYACHCDGAYNSRYCPFHGQRFHPYMTQHYKTWHERYFYHDNNRYMPKHFNYVPKSVNNTEKNVGKNVIRYRNPEPIRHEKTYNTHNPMNQKEVGRDMSVKYQSTRKNPSMRTEIRTTRPDTRNYKENGHHRGR
jgi:hypothetical protein